MKKRIVLVFTALFGISVLASSCSALLAPTNKTENNQNNTNGGGGKTNGGKTNGGGTTTNTGGKTKG